MSLKRGKLTRSVSQELDRATVIKDLNQQEFYKYLGVNESDGIQHVKEKIKECYRRVHAILRTEPNSANRIEAINHSYLRSYIQLQHCQMDTIRYEENGN